MSAEQADNGKMTIERPGALWVEADKASPRLTGLGWDTEGTGRHRITLLKAPVELRLHRNGKPVMPQVRFDAPDPWTARYNIAFANGAKLIFVVASRPDALGMRLSWEGDAAAAVDTVEMVFPFDPETAMTSIISERWTEDGKFLLPAIVSAPDLGQMLVTCAERPDLTGRLEGSRKDRWVTVTLELPAGCDGSSLELQFSPVVLPLPVGCTDSSRWQAARRGWFNFIQLSCGASGGGARVNGVWSNNVLSDPVSSVLYMLADATLLVPELAPGVRMAPILRRAVDYWLDHKTDSDGLVAYTAGGKEQGWNQNVMDANPSVLIGAWAYVTASNDRAWLERRIADLEFLSRYMESRDVDGDGLVESKQSGNSGSRPPRDPDCAWDCYCSGHKNAYANALVYRAWHGLAALEARLGRRDGQARYLALADRLRAAFCGTFHNPDTGWLGFWRSRDGKLHDLHMDAPTSVGVDYGLIEPAAGRTMLGRFWHALETSGFSRFDLGVPLNLRPVPREEMEHYTEFQQFLNGGCGVSNTSYLLNALYAVGMTEQADMILDAMLARQSKGIYPNGGAFQNGFRDSMGGGAEVYDWSGNPAGYEGHLVYCWAFLHSVLLREPQLLQRCRPNRTTTAEHPLVKQGAIKPIMGETTPFVFKGRLYRLENWQKFMEIPRATCGERYMEDIVRVWDVEADCLVSVALTGHSFGTAFVWKDRVHVYSAAHPDNNQWRTVKEITLTTSDDLLHWTPPEVVVRAEPGERLFNAAVCRGPDRFILLYETDDKRWPAFTFKYCESDDLRSWRLIPDAVYGRDKYVGGPALYFEGGWYYTLYLQDLGGKWETRITRSRDLINWDDAPVSRPFLTFDETRLFQYWHKGELRTVKEINASDAELCEWRGKTLVYFNGGDQQSAGDLQLAEFDGPPRRLFESFFMQPASLVPSDRQLAFQERQFGAFIHFGMATWYDGPASAVFPQTLREPHAFNLDQWGSMTAQPPAATFNPAGLNATQWAATAQAMGARHVVLTAKHHNGFCLWPTATTAYSVRNSPWRDGRGDVVREFAEAARAAGLGVGLYISAGDVNQGCFSTPEPMGTRRLIGTLDRYFPIFETQLREILGGYGELCEIWFDGALDPFGPDVQRPDGTRVETRYWDQLTAIARELQPNAVIMGGTRPDVRWTGNEEGLAPYPLWNVLYPGQEAANYLQPGVTGWLVPEADIFTRPSWFWTPDSDDGMASLTRLMDIYYRSIGHGANLLVNMTPDRRGRIPEAEAARLAEFGAAINRWFGRPLAQIDNAARWNDDMTLELPLEQPADIGHIVLEEDLRTGQRIRSYRIDARVDGQWREVAAGESVGRRRIQRLQGVRTDGLRLRVLDGDSPLNIRAFACFL